MNLAFPWWLDKDYLAVARRSRRFATEVGEASELFWREELREMKRRKRRAPTAIEALTKPHRSG
jgi:hypothetical protein